MPDNFETDLLKTLCSLCPDDDFVLVFEDEIAGALGVDYDGARDKTAASFKRLEVLGYIISRYCENGEYCFSITQKGRLYAADKQDKTSQKSSFLNCFLCVLRNFFTVFAATVTAVLFMKAVGLC